MTDASTISSNDDQSMLSLIDMVSSRKINLLEVVIGLEKYHTDGNADQRSKAINVLSTIIYEVAEIGLDSIAICALVQFFSK